MKILFASSPGVGHVQPAIGLALAARKRGHEIAWATARDTRHLLDAHLIDVFETGAPLAECRAEYRARWPEAATLKGRDIAAHAFPRLFGNVTANSMLPGFEHAIAKWKPNLIVSETGTVAAPLAARKFGVPQVTHAFGLPMPASTLHATAEQIAPLWQAEGWEVPAFAGLYDHGVIEISVPSLQAACPNPVLATQAWLQRPSSITAGPNDQLSSGLRDFLSSQSGRPIIYVTFGTIFNKNAGFTAALNAAAKIDALFVATTGTGNSTVSNESLARNVWVSDYVPQSLLLPLCTVVVSHAGSGTLSGAMSHGLPQLCLPQGADQFRNADALAACGAGISLEGNDVTESTIANAIQGLLEESSFRHNAEKLQREIGEMPTPDEVMAQLENVSGV
jgi:UDP:flavonoid glycosyltransferase YjiC (YdhE family)